MSPKTTPSAPSTTAPVAGPGARRVLGVVLTEVSAATPPHHRIRRAATAAGDLRARRWPRLESTDPAGVLVPTGRAEHLTTVTRGRGAEAVLGRARRRRQLRRRDRDRA